MRIAVSLFNHVLHHGLFSKYSTCVGKLMLHRATTLNRMITDMFADPCIELNS